MQRKNVLRLNSQQKMLREVSRNFWQKLLIAAITAGATVVNIPDTVGYTTPEEMAWLIEYLYIECYQH
jgi:isopropylmalate/homocitrate/citramalate synthase